MVLALSTRAVDDLGEPVEVYPASAGGGALAGRYVNLPYRAALRGGDKFSYGETSLSARGWSLS